MIVVRVELWSARTGHKTQLAEMHIANDGTGTMARRNYLGRVLRKPRFETVTREGTVYEWPAEERTIWHLVGRMLKSMGYV